MHKVIFENRKVHLLGSELGPGYAMTSPVHPQVAELAPCKHFVVMVVKCRRVICVCLDSSNFRDWILNSIFFCFNVEVRKLYFSWIMLSHHLLIIAKLTFESFSK